MLTELDLKTAIITVVFAPLMLYVLRTIFKFLRGRVQYALEGSIWHLSRTMDRRIGAAISLKQYSRNQLEIPWSKYLSVPGANSSVTLSTDAVFVPLELESSLLDSRRWSTHNVLEAGSRIMVVGDPGCGKSTLLKSLHRRLNRLSSRHPKHGRLVIAVELKSINVITDAGTDWMLDKLQSMVATSQGYEMNKLFDIYSTNSGVVVLLDGLDEVASTNYAEVTAAIQQLSDRLQERSRHNQVVLTMRSAFYQQVKSDYESTFPVTLHVQPLSSSELYEFLSCWPFPEDSARRVNALYAELTDSPSLRDLCTNPLILAMFVANRMHGEPGDTPDTRSRFYSAVMDELLALRRGRQLQTAARTALLESRWVLLGRLAFQNMLDSTAAANSLRWTDVIQAIQEDVHCDQQEAESRLSELIRDTGILQVQSKQESLHFIHLTFCEFLAARYAIHGRQDGFEVTLRRADEFARSVSPAMRSRLNEIVPFVCAQVLPKDRRMAFLRVADEISDSSVQAKCILEGQAYDHPLYHAWLVVTFSRVAGTPEDQWDINWLKDLQLFSRVLRDAELHGKSFRSKPLLTADTMLSLLVNKSRPRLVKLFGEFVQNDAAAALRLADGLQVDLAQTDKPVLVRACENQAFLMMALENATSVNPSKLEAWADIFVEAALRYRMVAANLHGLISTALVADRAIERGRRSTWFRPGKTFVHKRQVSMYTDLATIAASRSDGPQRSDVAPTLPMLASMAKIKPPGSLTPAILFYLPALLFVGTFIAYAVAYGFTKTAAGQQPVAPNTPLTTLQLVIVSIFAVSLELGAFAAAIYVNVRSDVYSMVLNLGRFDPFGYRNSSSLGRILRLSSRVTARLLLPKQSRVVRNFLELRVGSGAGPTPASGHDRRI